MRWRPPVSLGESCGSELRQLFKNTTAGLDHSSDVDEEYEGLRIPAGSSIIANLKYD